MSGSNDTPCGSADMIQEQVEQLMLDKVTM